MEYPSITYWRWRSPDTGLLSEIKTEINTSASNYVEFKAYISRGNHVVVSEDWTVIKEEPYFPPYVSPLTPEVVTLPSVYDYLPTGSFTKQDLLNIVALYPDKFKIGSDGKIYSIELVPTSSTTPLISNGVAQKLLEAGFSNAVVDPLTQTGWNTTMVENLIKEEDKIARILPIEPEITLAYDSKPAFELGNIMPLMLIVGVLMVMK